MRLKETLLAGLSGVLLSLAFPSANFEFLAWAAFVPLLMVLSKARGKRAFFFAFVSGLVFWVSTIYWLVHVTVFGTMLLVGYLSLFWGVWGVFVSFLFSCEESLMSLRAPKGRSNPTNRLRSFFARNGRLVLLAFSIVLLVPASWVLLEYARSYLLTGFPWALLGYSQSFTLPVIQVADLTGVWGVSFLVMLSNVVIFGCVRGQVTGDRCKVVGEKSGVIGSFILLGVVGLFVFLYGSMKLTPNSSHRSPNTLSVAVIQGNIPQHLKWDRNAQEYILRQYFSLSAKAAVGAPDVIVWPEAALPTALTPDDTGYQPLFDKFLADCNAPLLIGAVTMRNDRFYNSAVFIQKSGNQLYDKIHLVPFGEYIPLRSWLRFLETIAPIGDIAAGTQYSLFNVSNRNSGGHVPLGVLICFEDVFPDLARQFTLRGAGGLVTITNDAWYMKTSAAVQHAQASVFRAVENRRPVVRAANTGYSCFISSTGAITGAVQDSNGEPLFVAGSLQQDVQSGEGVTTVYTRWGDWFVGVCAGMVCCFLFFAFVFRKGRSRPPPTG